MLILISLIIITLFLDTIVLNKIGRFSPNWSIIISIARIISCLIYGLIFPLNDLNAFHWDVIIQCENEAIFKFTSLAKFFYCNGIFQDKSQINLVYSFIGTIFLSILIRLSKYIQLTSFINYENKRNNEISDQISRYFHIIFLLTPNSLFYTSVISKDIFQFCFIVSILLFLIRPSSISGINLIFTSLFILFSRPYVFFMLTIAGFLALILPDFYLKVTKFKYIFQLRDKYKTIINRTCIVIISLPIFYFLLEFFFPALNTAGITLKALNLFSLEELIIRWTVDMGGNLAVPPDTNVFIKYIYFWILPMPFLQSGLGALVIGLSTLFSLFLVFKILEKGILIKNYILKFLLSIIIIYSIAFSVTMSNTGVSSRYRFTTILPILFILYDISNYQLKEFNHINSKS